MTGYQPKGTMETIHGVETYVARPSTAQPKGIVIIIPDAFGQPFPNNKHLADTYASDGSFLVYLPEFMDGHAAPSHLISLFPKLLDPQTWFETFMKPLYLGYALYYMAPFIYYTGFNTSMPRVQAFFEAVRDNESTQQNLSIACAGFCWGGKHTFALASGEYKSTKSGKVLCDAHFTAHPSNVKVPDEAKKVKLPLSIAAATRDKVMTVEQAREVEAILTEKASKDGLKHSGVTYYEGAGHGFGVRADPTDKDVVKHAEASVKQAINFFNSVFNDLKGS